MGSGFHGEHRRFLGDRAGDDNKRQVVPPFFQQGQCGHRVEVRNAVVGDHHVPLLSSKSAIHRSGRVHAFVPRVVAATSQFMQQQLGVVFGVFDDQDAKGLHD